MFKFIEHENAVEDITTYSNAKELDKKGAGIPVPFFNVQLNQTKEESNG
ncbi:MAG: hypothetical protein VW833_00235 [Candidatus Neomarinimicrobiota bacterium]|jgi:hypothetical protein